MTTKSMTELQVGDSVKLPGYSPFVKISEIRESDDRYTVEFLVNNSVTSCVLLKAMMESFEPFEVKPATRT